MKLNIKIKKINSTKRAAQELWQLRMDLYDVIEILEKGYDCSTSKRKTNIIEKCINKYKKIIKVVLVEHEDFWFLIYAGKFGRR